MFKSLIIAALTTGSMVSALSCSDSTLHLQSDGDAATVAACEVVKGNIELGTAVTSVDLTGLQQCKGSLTCNNCANLTSLIAPDLRSIGGDFKLSGMILLGTLSMGRLSHCGSIQFSTLPNLSQMNFAPINQADDVLITDTILSDLGGIDLENCNTFDVNNNRYLKSITMKNLQTVSTSYSITYNAKAVDVSLPNMIWANNLTFRDVGSVDIPSLGTVNGSFGMINCTFEKVEFANLTNVGQSLALVSDNQLTSISMPALTKVGGGFQISNNTALKNVDGIGKLQSVGGAIDFNGAMNNVSIPKVNDVRGGFNIQTTGNIDCSKFQSLKDNGDVQGTFTCKGGLQTNQVGGYGQDKGGGSGSKSGASGIFVSGFTLVGATLFSLFYIL